MYKLLIADDEKNIRDGLKAILDWEDIGYEIIAEAANGEEAVNKILSLNPDVVLMDIHMPKFYGLEAIKAVKDAGFIGKFIILSGYSDFAYAQSAMRYGVEFYLTKPIDEDELLSVVTKIKEDLDNRSIVEENVRLYKDKAKNVILHEIITGTVSMSELSTMTENELSKLGLLAEDYQVVIYEKFGLSLQDPAYDVVEMLKTIEQNEYEFDAFEEDGNKLILLKGHSALRKFEHFIEKYRQDEIMEGSPLDSVFIVYGRPVQSIDEIYLSYEEALTLSKRRYFCEQGQHVLGYEDLDENYNSSYEVLNDELLNDYANRIVDCIQTFNRGALAETMHSIELKIYSLDIDRNNIVIFMLDLYMRIQEKAVRHWPDVELPFNNKEVIYNIRTANYFYEIVMLITDQIKNVMNLLDNSNRDTIVSDILYYIDHNYQSNITLEAIAPLFGYSSAYIGKLIYKAVGEYFNSYVDRKRIEKSKVLLAEENIKVYEIANRVGYGNVDYFHKKFKKFEGISPAQYRKNLKEST